MRMTLVLLCLGVSVVSPLNLVVLLVTHCHSVRIGCLLAGLEGDGWEMFL